MARPTDLKGYARKRALGLVPHPYPPVDRRRGVVPPIGFAEARRLQDEAARRHGVHARRALGRVA